MAYESNTSLIDEPAVVCGQTTITFVENGSITSPGGFSATGVHAGFKAAPEVDDLALIVADEPCAAAGVFTQNVFRAAPVEVSQEHLLKTGDGDMFAGQARAMVINSGCANAATGEQGLTTARKQTALVADEVGCTEDEVLVASTGVIGVQLPFDIFETGAVRAAHSLSSDTESGIRAARAIMTTDTVAKHAAVQFSGDEIGYPGSVFTIGGIAKGSGMIMPNMATMISVLTTDAPLSSRDLHAALAHAVNKSFNKITVDSDTSTNDTCVIMASGVADQTGTPFENTSTAYETFCCALDALCTKLARTMACDGEGATKLVTVNVEGALTPEDADLAARTVANSPLVKTAIAGHDANWGRIAAALGKSGAVFRQEDVDIVMMGMLVCHKGLACAFSEEEALLRFNEPEIVIDVNLGSGDASATIWTCDLTHEYISINGDYRS